MKNGQEIEFNSLEVSSRGGSDNNYPSQFSDISNSTMQYFIDYIDIDEVESVSFNGVETTIQKDN